MDGWIKNGFPLGPGLFSVFSGAMLFLGGVFAVFLFNTPGGFLAGFLNHQHQWMAGNPLSPLSLEGHHIQGKRGIFGEINAPKFGTKNICLSIYSIPNSMPDNAEDSNIWLYNIIIS